MTEHLRGDGAVLRQSLYGSSVERTYAGVLSFLRRRSTRELSGVGVDLSATPLALATTLL